MCGSCYGVRKAVALGADNRIRTPSRVLHSVSVVRRKSGSASRHALETLHLAPRLMAHVARHHQCVSILDESQYRVGYGCGRWKTKAWFLPRFTKKKLLKNVVDDEVIHQNCCVTLQSDVPTRNMPADFGKYVL